MTGFEPATSGFADQRSSVELHRCRNEKWSGSWGSNPGNAVLQTAALDHSATSASLFVKGPSGCPLRDPMAIGSNPENPVPKTGVSAISPGGLK